MLKFFILTFILCFVISPVKSETETPYLRLPPNTWSEEIPLLCAEAITFNNVLKQSGYKLVKSSQVKEGAVPNGKLLLIIAEYYHNKLKTHKIVTLTTEIGETCILFASFNEKNVNMEGK